MDRRIIRAIGFLNRRLRDSRIRWVIIGSTSLAIQGVKVSPNDIDVLTDRDGAFKIAKLLEKYQVRRLAFRRSGRFESYFAEYRIEGIKVQVAGDMRIRYRGSWTSLLGRLKSTRKVSVGGLMTPVSPLRAQLLSYEKLGRRDDLIKIRKIREVLSQEYCLLTRNASFGTLPA